MTLLIESALKVTVVLVVALAAAALGRRQSAALRHWVLAVAVICGLIVPVLGAVTPRWRIGVEAPPFVRALSGPSLAKPDPRQPVEAGAAAEQPVEQAPLDVARLAFGTWLAGASLGTLVLLAALIRLRGLARRARPVADERWIAIASELARDLQLRRPVVLLESSAPDALMTWGAWSPRIMIPAGAGAWSDHRIRIVLRHELAHVQRADWVVQLAAELLRVMYWFNPLVWMACRQLRLESEHACDDAVLTMGIAGTEYAGELLEFARTAGRRRGSWLPAAAMAQTSSLERRVKAMLNGTVNRRPVPRRARWSVAGATFVASIAVTGLTLAGQTFSSVAGSILDATNRVLPGVTMKLTSVQTGAEYTIKSDASGRYEFVGLPFGEYAIRAQMPGFSTLTGKLVLVGAAQTSFDMRLDVGSLEETMTIADGWPGFTAPLDSPMPLPKATCEPKAVGGNIRAPRQLTRARPDYPASLGGSGRDEVVVLQALIGTDGTIREVVPVGTPTPEFANAAMDAVRQWTYSQTLLNCEPIEVRMKVTAHFKPAPPPPPPPPAAGKALLQLTQPDGITSVLKLASGQSGWMTLRDGWRYRVTPTIQTGVTDRVELFIEGASPSNQFVETHLRARLRQTFPATAHAPFAISLLEITN